MLTRCGLIFSGDSGQQQWAELLAAVSWAPGQPWNHERKQPTHLHSFCTHTTILVFTFSVCVLSRCCCVWLFVTPWTVALKAPLSMEFSRKKYWSGLPFPSPGNLPNPRIKPRSSAFQADSLPLIHLGRPIYAAKCISSLFLLIATNCHQLMVLISGFFYFPVVRKQYTFSRNHTWNF